MCMCVCCIHLVDLAWGPMGLTKLGMQCRHAALGSLLLLQCLPPPLTHTHTYMYAVWEGTCAPRLAHPALMVRCRVVDIVHDDAEVVPHMHTVVNGGLKGHTRDAVSVRPGRSHTRCSMSSSDAARYLVLADAGKEVAQVGVHVVEAQLRNGSCMALLHAAITPALSPAAVCRCLNTRDLAGLALCVPPTFSTVLNSRFLRECALNSTRPPWDSISELSCRHSADCTAFIVSPAQTAS